MSRGQTGATIIHTILCVSAVAVCITVVLMEGELGAALTAAVLLLGVAQMVSFMSRSSEKDRFGAKMRDIMQASDALSRELSVLRSRMNLLETRGGQEPDQSSGELVNQVSSLRQTVDSMRRQLARSHPGGTGHAPVQTGEREPLLLGQPAADAARLYLEPVVRMATGKTAHYRTQLVAEDGENGARFDAESGAATLMLFERTAPVIRRLQMRNRLLGVFCPVSARALADETFLNRLVDFVEHNKDIAGSLVVDISQSALGQLDEAGQKGLAYLAQMGATFCLSDCRLNVPDLDALAALGFGFIDANVQLIIDARRSAPCPASEMIGSAQRLGMSLIAADVEKENELSWIREGVELARGRRFSPPRAVRQDISEVPQHSAAA